VKPEADKLRSELEGHVARMKSPLWQKDDGRADEDWTASLKNDPPASSDPVSGAPM
jgi:hypothetical protein